MDFAFVADQSTELCSEESTATVKERFSEESFRNQSTLPPSTPSVPGARGVTGTYATLGVISAIVSLNIVPEIFGAAAIILGAYTWRREQGNRGIYIVILGIICMLLGLYFTAFFILGDLLPS